MTGAFGKSLSGRRAVLQGLSAAALSTSFERGVRRAMALPAYRRTHSIEDVEHVVILMQSGRSFDHYFGALQGVRGFNDPHPARLSSGAAIWAQPDGNAAVFPFRPDEPDLGARPLSRPSDDWEAMQRAAGYGHWGDWAQAKEAASMVHMLRDDIPYHYALADAFTVCDSYYSSVLGPAGPNRSCMWSGWVGNDGRNGGPMLDDAGDGYSWRTCPERLDMVGVSWRVYQDAGQGLTAEGHWGASPDAFAGNGGDNTLLRFKRFQAAADGTPLARAARSGAHAGNGNALLADFEADVKSGVLPQVSWIVAPEAYSERADWPANYGAWYAGRVLDILTSNPEIWGRTALFLTYDGSGGFFDHVVPPLPPFDTTRGASTIATDDEFFPGSAKFAAGPYGMGPRVPMLVISPWSRGGWVNSQVFDHTSLIRFLERRFDMGGSAFAEDNITPWRRAVAGDLTSAFDFSSANDKSPALPSTAPFAPKNHERRDVPSPRPSDLQRMPEQETGTRPARALPYDLHVSATPHRRRDTLSLNFENSGNSAAIFQLRDGLGISSPRFYTVTGGENLRASWDGLQERAYDVAVHGPNGFYRSFKGAFADASAAQVGVATKTGRDHHSLVVILTNHGGRRAHMLLTDIYTGVSVQHVIPPHEEKSVSVSVTDTSGWYDLKIGEVEDRSYETVLAGHVEDGHPSNTDPGMGKVLGARPPPGGPFGDATRKS